MPLVSVVMPYYRGSEYLEEAIASIQRQSLRDWELLVVTEPGHDAKDILERIAQSDNRIRILMNPGPLGISPSLNYGMQMSTGRYIARMDADDIAQPQRLQTQADFLDAHPDVILCGSRIEEFGQGTMGWSLEFDADQLRTDILFYSPCVHPTVMFRRNVFEEYGIWYRHDFRASEDYAFFADISRIGKIANLDEALLRYRVSKKSATHRQADEGVRRYLQVMDEQFRNLGLAFSQEELDILCVHKGPGNMGENAAIPALTVLDLLLKRILAANEKKKVYNKYVLFRTLRKRFREACSCLTWRRHLPGVRKSAAEVWERSIFRFEEFYRPRFQTAPEPVISVVLPTFNSEQYIVDTLWSILCQTEPRFEILLLNEFGSCDDTVLLAGIFQDPRVHVIQNEKKLGLAETLNQGIRMAAGQYIARADSDDIYSAQRFEKQLAYMEAHPACGVCGTWQHHFGLRYSWEHCPPPEHEPIKASTIYKCEMCHSTLMLRKSAMLSNNLFYDGSFAAEDFELWTRAVHRIEFHNLPEILGEYRWNGQNITKAKQLELYTESAELVARNLKDYLDITVSPEHIPYLNGWRNEIRLASSLGIHAYKTVLFAERDLLRQIWEQNQKKRIYQPEALLGVLTRRWCEVTGCTRDSRRSSPAKSIDSLLGRAGSVYVFYALARFQCLARNIREAVSNKLRNLVWK